MRGEPKTAAFTSQFLLAVANAPMRVSWLNMTMACFLSMSPPFYLKKIGMVRPLLANGNPSATLYPK